MDTATPTHPPLADEPFGQRGVRQYVGRALAWICVMALTMVLALWHRSGEYLDRIEWRSPESELRISSLAGRLKIEAYSYPGRRMSNVGWYFRMVPLRRVVDAWEPSILKTIGIEIGFGSERSDTDRGVWLRVKWYFVAGVLLIIPVWRAVARLRRRDEDGDEDDQR